MANWTLPSTLSGGWGASINIALPPPVSFISVNLYIGYNYNFALSAYLRFFSPNNVTAGCTVNGTVTAIGSAGLRLLVIEGGVYISGTIARALAEPSLSGLIVSSPNRLVGTAMIRVTIYPLNFSWGFYYRYWRFWGGWTGHIPITTWNIAQVAIPTIPVYSVSFTIYF